MSSVSAEIVDLRYLNPIDLSSVISSVEKTGRLIVIDAEHDGPSLGNQVAAKVLRSFPSASVSVLHRKGQFLGCSEAHERECLIYENDIQAAIREAMK